MNEASISVSNITPTPGYVLVKPAEGRKQTKSGIYLPDSSDEKPQHGTVIACGEDLSGDEPGSVCPVKKNDLVIYKQWGGSSIKLDDVEYQFLKFEDVLGVVAGAPAKSKKKK